MFIRSRIEFLPEFMVLETSSILISFQTQKSSLNCSIHSIYLDDTLMPRLKLYARDHQQKIKPTAANDSSQVMNTTEEQTHTEFSVGHPSPLLLICPSFLYAHVPIVDFLWGRYERFAYFLRFPFP